MRTTTPWLFGGVLSLACLFACSGVASAATLFVSPAAGQYAVGSSFSITARVNSQGTAVNAIEGQLSFNPAIIRVLSVTSPGSIFNLNVQEPEYSNDAGTVRWTGVILNPGYTGASGNLITVTFRAIAQGEARVSYASGAVLANDGQGTNVLSTTGSALYTIGPATSSPVPSPASSRLLAVTSTTHVDSLKWYSSNDPQFFWENPAGTDGVSYLISARAIADPGNVSDGVVTTATFTDVADGAQYFHVKVRVNGVWGSPAHFPFNIDSGYPAAFTIERVDGDDTTNPRPLLTFQSRDDVSGIASYMMRIGDGEWFAVPESSTANPFTMPLQAPGIREVLVEAIDRAGNATRAARTIVVEPLTPITIDEARAVGDDAGTLAVVGHATKNTTVTLVFFQSTSRWRRLLFSDTVVARYAVATDATGVWRMNIPGMPAGRYQLRAQAADARGAQSLWSAPVTVTLGGFRWSSLIQWIVSLLLGLLVLAFLIWLLWLLMGRTRRRDIPIVVAPRRDRSIITKLDQILLDMDGEMDTIDMLARHRPLYPEERYLKSKIAQYRKALSVFATNRKRLGKRS